MFSAERKLSPQYLTAPLAYNLAELVVHSGALQEGDFTFSSGIKSPLKIELDVLRSRENFQVHRDLSECMFIMMHELEMKPDVVVGVIRGGVSFARDLSSFWKKPFAARLGIKRDDERKKEVRGTIDEGAQVLVVEDVVTFGTNSIPCVLDLRGIDKANVLGVISVYDHGFFRAREGFKENCIPHWSLLYFQDLINVLRRSGKDVGRFEDWHASISSSLV